LRPSKPRLFQNSPNYLARDDLALVYPDFSTLPLTEQIDLEAAVLWRASQRDRLAKLIPLSRAGVKFFGDPHWRNFLPDASEYGGHLHYHRELPLFYQCVDINVNVTSLQMKDGLNQRVFDVPAAGGFLLTDDKEALWEIFAPEEVATFRTVAEAKEKLAFFLRHPEVRQEKRAKARSRILTEHTYLHRVQSLLAQLAKEFFPRARGVSVARLPGGRKEIGKTGPAPLPGSDLF
jgi:spore maturation protein CgeB